MSGDPVFCQCPSPWFGTVPPVCPVHNPQSYSMTFGAQMMTGTTINPFAQNELTAAQVISRLYRELEAARRERDDWKRRAEQHGCDTERGDPDCG